MMAMALAGAERIFQLIDEESETDNGYVTLVRVITEMENMRKQTISPNLGVENIRIMMEH